MRICEVGGCDRSHYALGCCKLHYQRLRKYGDAETVIRERWWLGLKPEERFWFQVSKSDGCWLWTGARRGSAPHQYGTLWDGSWRIGKNGRKLPQHVGAHRFSYRLLVGDIPEGMEICHHCDNSLCVNPEHLFVGTHADNMKDMVVKNRADNRGVRNGRSKLTAEDVAEIRRLSTGRHGEGMEFARRFGVTSATISKVIRGDTWTSLP